MIVGLGMAFDQLIMLQDRLTLDLYQLMNNGLRNPDSHFVILRLFVVVDREQVLVNNKQNFVNG